MSRRQTLLAISIFIIVIQLSGFTPELRKSFTIAASLGLIAISYFMKKEEPQGELTTPVFSESRKEILIQQH